MYSSKSFAGQWHNVAGAIHMRMHTSCDDKATTCNVEFSVVKRWFASLPWQRHKMKKKNNPRVSAGKPKQ